MAIKVVEKKKKIRKVIKKLQNDIDNASNIEDVKALMHEILKALKVINKRIDE